MKNRLFSPPVEISAICSRVLFIFKEDLIVNTLVNTESNTENTLENEDFLKLKVTGSWFSEFVYSTNKRYKTIYIILIL